MAAEVEETLCQLVKNVLEQAHFDCERIKVCRKTKDLVYGDFVIPKGVLTIDLASETAKACQLGETLQQATAEDTLPVSRVSQDKYNSIVFHIDRNRAYTNIIREVLKERESYGYQTREKTNKKVVINPVDLNVKNSSDEASGDSLVSLTQLRGVVLLKHIMQLLTANGCQPELAPLFASSSVQDLLDILQAQLGQSPSSQDDVDKMCDRLLTHARDTEYYEVVEAKTREGDTEDRRPENGGTVLLNLRCYLENRQLSIGKDGYDKNLNLAAVKQEDGSVSDALRGAAIVETIVSTGKASGEPGSETCCIHLVSQSLAFSQQQADLVWKICTPTPSQLISQHFVFGTVGQRKSSSSPSTSIDAKEFYNMRYMQMTQAAMMKYGDHDQGTGWDDMITGLTAASLTFDILGTAAQSQVQLDLSDEDGEGGVDNRSGPFVLYNCARLASLLNSFEQQVEQGTYPALPEASGIDFSLLREEEEWSMAFLYIFGFPRLVQETVSNWTPSEGISAHIHTHKVSHFLLNFSKVLSSYYSRYHILGGSEAHLLPLMFARLSLMKAAHQVLCNGLKLLGLQPFAQL